MPQSVSEQIRPFPAVKPEGHFFTVRLEMLCANTVPAASDAALQERECRFNRVGMRLALCVNVKLVANRLVPSGLAKVSSRAPVGQRIIRKEHVHIFADVLADVLFKGTALNVFRVEEAKFAPSLTDANDVALVCESLFLSLVSIDSADEGFVHLDFSVKHWPVHGDHSGANPMTEIPCRLVADAERSLHLARAHSFLCFTEKERSREPLFERQMRIVEDRPGCDGELVAA